MDQPPADILIFTNSLNYRVLFQTGNVYHCHRLVCTGMHDVRERVCRMLHFANQQLHLVGCDIVLLAELLLSHKTEESLAIQQTV